MYEVYALSLDGYTFRYVGLTTRGVKERFKRHQAAARRGDDFPVYRWMRKHGPENVQVRVLCRVAHSDELGLAEQWWIAELRELDFHLLNCTVGGQSAFTRVEPSALKGRQLTRPSALRGRPLTEEHKAKISVAVTGKMSEERKAAIRVRNRVIGRTTGFTGRLHTEETKAKLRSTFQGKPLSAEHKAKLSASARADWQRRKAAYDSPSTDCLARDARATTDDLAARNERRGGTPRG